MEKKVNYKLVNLSLVVLTIFFLYRTGHLWMGIVDKIVDKVKNVDENGMIQKEDEMPVIEYIKRIEK